MFSNKRMHRLKIPISSNYKYKFSGALFCSMETDFWENGGGKEIRKILNNSIQ